MYRRDRIGSGSNVSSLASSFSKKSREANAIKENIPSRLPRGSAVAPASRGTSREPPSPVGSGPGSGSKVPTQNGTSPSNYSTRLEVGVLSPSSSRRESATSSRHESATSSRHESATSSRRESTTSSVSSTEGEIPPRIVEQDLNARLPSPKFVNPEQAGYVGFANLPNQVHRKSVKKGFEFTLMVVGESGLGKSTLVNSLFLTDLYPERHIPTAQEKIQQTVKIDASTVEIEERGVKLRLTVVDTPGFGDSLNSVDCFKPIIQYVDDQFERYLNDESGLNRRHIIDNRVHCCFYFINPSGHGLRPLDITFMKAVHHKVNIVPVLAKADTLTKKEVLNLKKKIMGQVEQYGINLYPLPDCDDDEDEDYKEQCRQLKDAVPFAVVGSNTVIEVKGKKVRGRMYPWGVVEVENPDHCDFIKLRTMLITHMQDLQEVTQEVHYENFRAERLASGAAAPAKKPSSESVEVAPSAPAEEQDTAGEVPGRPKAADPPSPSGPSAPEVVRTSRMPKIPSAARQSAPQPQEMLSIEKAQEVFRSPSQKMLSIEKAQEVFRSQSVRESRAPPTRGEQQGGDQREQALQEKEKELRRMQEMLAKMQAEMAAQKGGGAPQQNGGGK